MIISTADDYRLLADNYLTTVQSALKPANSEL